MGQTGSAPRTLTDQELSMFAQQSQLQPHIIQQLYTAFMERAGRDGRMTVTEFKAIYTEIDPNANAFNFDANAERVFMLFDRDRNGVLTFDEFMMAYILLQRGAGDPVNRWQSVMGAMPAGAISRPGYLNNNEAAQLLQHMNQFYQFPNFNPNMQHNTLWNQATPQVDPSGYIPQADFIRLLSAQPQLQQHIW